VRRRRSVGEKKEKEKEKMKGEEEKEAGEENARGVFTNHERPSVHGVA